MTHLTLSLMVFLQNSQSTLYLGNWAIRRLFSTMYSGSSDLKTPYLGLISLQYLIPKIPAISHSRRPDMCESRRVQALEYSFVATPRAFLAESTIGIDPKSYLLTVSPAHLPILRALLRYPTIHMPWIHPCGAYLGM